jgi:hypothetical protein
MIRAAYTDNSEQALASIKKQIGERLVDAARAVRDVVVEEIEDAPPRTGRKFRDPRTGRIARRSAPGEAPGGTGAYAESWDYTREPREEGSQLITSAGSNMQSDAGIPLGADLEFGVTVEPRPHARKALPKGVPRVQAALGGES